MTKYVLAIDGGGVRGLIPCIILAEIERIKRKPISKMFDFMSGASSGAIATAALALIKKDGTPKYTSEEVVTMFRKGLPFVLKTTHLKYWRSLVSGPLLYDENLEKFLNDYFQDYRLIDTSTDLLLHSYDIYNNMPLFFKSWRDDCNFIKIKDALYAAVAAPTYFSPKIITLYGIEHVLVNGGLFANNPATCAYVGARKLFPKDDIVILSLGTGRRYWKVIPETAKFLGTIQWIKPLINTLYAANLKEISYHMNSILADKYIRINADLTHASDDLIDCSAKNMRNIEKEAEIMLKMHEDVIKKFCDMLE